MRSETQTATDAPEEGRYKLGALLALSEVASSLSAASDVDTLLARYLGTMMRIAGAHAGTVRVLSADGTQLRLVSSAGLPPELAERERLVPADCGTCGDALRGLSATSAVDLAYCRAAMRHEFFADCAELYAVPIRVHGTTLGLFNLFLRRAGGLPDEVRALFGTIGEHLGIALENARLTREAMRATLLGERQLLASHVHDSIAQTLAYGKMRFAALREAERAGEHERAGRYLAEIEDALEVAYSDLRQLITQFREPTDSRGLAAAVSDAVEAFRERTGLEAHLELAGGDLGLSPEAEVQAFYIVQEALANVQRHADARRVQVRLERRDSEFVASVEDDGAGFTDAEAHAEGHFGMAIMRERAGRVGGSLKIESRAGEGTRVRLSIPSRR